MEPDTLQDPSIFGAIAAHPIATFVRESMWAYPILETFHMFGLGLLFGAIVVFDLRVLGVGARTIAVSRAAALLLPWVWVGFGVNLVSGGLLFASGAVEFSGNRAFQLKMLFVLIAGLNALVFMTRRRDVMNDWDSAVMANTLSRWQAALSIACWSLVIAAGRFVAYFE